MRIVSANRRNCLLQKRRAIPLPAQGDFGIANRAFPKNFVFLNNPSPEPLQKSKKYATIVP